MSAASRYKATAPQRERRRVAREIAKLEHGPDIFCSMCSGMGSDPFEPGDIACELCEGTGSGRHVFMLALLSDPRQGFDVARAREHTESLIALEAEQDAFEDWTREQGNGPERSPCTACGGGGGWMSDEPNGESYEQSCSKCEVDVDSFGTGIEPWPGNLAGRWETERNGDRRAPMGRSLARLGRAIQRALKGQPSLCVRCDGSRLRPCPGRCAGVLGRDCIPCGATSTPGQVACSNCYLDGHNLRGVLPPVEWSAQVRRKVADSCAAMGDRIDGWTARHPAGNAAPTVTRVVPRGTHRDDIDRARTVDMTVDQRINARGWDTWDDELKTEALPYGHQGPRNRIGWLFDAQPRWRRGELRHAEQRRKRGQS